VGGCVQLISKAKAKAKAKHFKENAVWS